MQIVFILVEPKVPENVGASARALKTMGFSQLRIVNSEQHLQPEASWLAHGSNEILEQASCFDTLGEALADLDLVIGTTAKERHQRRQLLAPHELRENIALKGSSVNKVGIVFGAEDRGLSNEEVAQCALLTTVPLAVTYPSLNLSQAVMLYAYELSGLQQATSVASPEEAQLSVLRAKLTELLGKLDIDQEAKEHRWIMDNLALLGEKDIHFMHTLSKSIARKI